MEKRTYGAGEVAQLLGVSKAYAYKLIRRLNAELEEEGMLTIPGKVSATYLEARFFGNTGNLERGGKNVG